MGRAKALHGSVEFLFCSRVLGVSIVLSHVFFQVQSCTILAISDASPLCRCHGMVRSVVPRSYIKRVANHSLHTAASWWAGLWDSQISGRRPPVTLPKALLVRVPWPLVLFATLISGLDPVPERLRATQRRLSSPGGFPSVRLPSGDGKAFFCLSSKLGGNDRDYS